MRITQDCESNARSTPRFFPAETERHHSMKRGCCELRCCAAETRRDACGDGMKRIGGFGRAAHRDGLPVRVCFPEACAKLISVKSSCQTFLTDGK
ncbi:hypothetical protein [Burkholderia ambifaria]|uniref:hypothetical protein n=1 Tax=Burkholderia ambifaria TaxID=152480 RepID=UPI000F8077D9|nr:hypothetical protein [Burkholderia ambifaria]